MGTLKIEGKVLELVADAITGKNKYVVHVAPKDQEFCESHLDKTTVLVLTSGSLSLAFNGRISKISPQSNEAGEPHVEVEISQ
jgi:hypothetical protein